MMNNQIIGCGIKEIMRVTEKSQKEILRHIATGKILAFKTPKGYVFSASERERLVRLKEKTVGLFSFAHRFITKENSFCIEKSKCKNDLIAFMTENSWFGANIITSEDAFFIGDRSETIFLSAADIQKVELYVKLWVTLYGQSNDVKLQVFQSRLKSRFPETEKIFSTFLETTHSRSNEQAWVVANYLCAKLRKEITVYSAGDLEELVADINRTLPIGAANLFGEFTLYLRNNQHGTNGWIYQFHRHSHLERNHAYSPDEFFKMAYIVFNETAWGKENLCQKANQSATMANLWAFVAFHFICAWRGTDIVRIPKPTFDCDGKTVRERIMVDCFETEKIIKELELRLSYMPMKPNKTANYDVPNLKLCVPESLRKPMGYIFAIAASHHDDVEPGKPFLHRAGNYCELKKFFGSDFIAENGEGGFSSRRANKTYLQGIEALAQNRPGKPKGYMLAALARSHKGGYGALPQTTEIYLRDARFSGYSPEFIAREMFERGVFSFIPSLLLDIYEAEAKLSVSVRTSLVQEIGIAPMGIENISEAVAQALSKARLAVSEIMQSPKNMRTKTEDILQNIASGYAVGRQNGVLCLMTAASFPCKCPERNCCIGCGYEIYTNTIMRELISEYSRLLAEIKNSDAAEGERKKKILKQAVMPAISEMLISAKRLYPDAEQASWTEILKGGLQIC